MEKFGSGMEKSRIRDKHPGSETMFESGKTGRKMYGGDQRRIPWASPASWWWRRGWGGSMRPPHTSHTAAKNYQQFLFPLKNHRQEKTICAPKIGEKTKTNKRLNWVEIIFSPHLYKASFLLCMQRNKNIKFELFAPVLTKMCSGTACLSVLMYSSEAQISRFSGTVLRLLGIRLFFSSEVPCRNP